MQKRKFIWSLTGISALLGFMLTVQLTTRIEKGSNTQGLASYLDLRTEIQEQLQEHQILTAQISKQTAQLVQYNAVQTGSEAEKQSVLKQDAKTVAAEAGMTKITGTGITITIQDDPSLPFIQQYAGLFQTSADQEISQIVNDLFANGAQAISINGQRLVTTSSIRLISGLSGPITLQVNTNPIAEPYVITAMGNVSLMQAVLQVTQVQVQLNLMQEDCLIKAFNSPAGVTLPAYQGSLPGQYAKELTTQ